MKTIFRIAFGLSLAVALMGCDTYYNDQNFEGYDNNATTDVKTISMTLTDADYAAIAANATNKSLAGDNVAALTAVGKNKYFTDDAKASVYVPAYLANLYHTADNESAIKVTYQKASATDAATAKIAAANTYTVATEDYQTAWESEEKFVEYFTPATGDTKHIAKVLKAQFPDAEGGDYAIATYKYAQTEPVFGSTGGEDEGFVYTDVVANIKVGDVVDIKGIVSGICAQGFMISDNSATVLVYVGKTYDPTLYPVGTQMKVNGTISSYNGGLQVTGSSATIEVVDTVEYVAPAAALWTAADLEEYSALIAGGATVLAQYVTYTGKLVKSGNYYNVILGESTSQGSLYQVISGSIDDTLDGKTVDITGWVIAASGTNKIYVNTIFTSIVENRLGNVIGTLAKGDETEFSAVVTALITRGCILTDNSGSILYYNAAGTDLAIGDVVNVSGTVSSYGTALQIPAAATITKTGSESVAYPSAATLTGADIDAIVARTDDQGAYYASMTGKVTISGNYYNVVIDGTTNQGSIYYATDEIKGKLENDVTYTLNGYVVSVSSGKYANFVVVSVETPKSGVQAATRAAAPVINNTSTPSTRYAIFKFDGTNWTVDSSCALLQPADYTAMGQSYGTLSAPSDYLPQYMNTNFPYAQKNDTKYVVYKYYANSTTSWAADRYDFDGNEWSKYGIESATDQFVRSGGKWVFDPSVVINLLPVKGNATSVAYYQAVVDWVAANKGDAYYQSGYTNAEYYYGASAYYCNITWIADKWRTDCKDNSVSGYAALSDTNLAALQAERLKDAFIAALEKYNSDLSPVEGAEVTATIRFGLYTGTTLAEPNHAIVYKVVGTGKFEYLSDSDL